MRIGRARRTELLSLRTFTDDELEYLDALMALATVNTYVEHGGDIYREMASIEEDIYAEQARRHMLSVRGCYDATY